MRKYAFALLISATVSTSAFAYDETVTRSQTTTVQGSAPSVAVIPDAQTSVSKRVEVNRSNGLGDNSNVVTEQTVNSTAPAVVVPAKPVSTTKTTELHESNSLGDQRSVQTKQTVNGDGYMAREEYHEKKNY